MMGIKKSCILAIVLLTSCSDDDEKYVTLLDDDFNNSPGWQYVSTANHVGTLRAFSGKTAPGALDGKTSQKAGVHDY
jgi:hypothetical protein